jgi:Caspase domain
MARFLLSALSVITLVFSAEITRTPAFGSQHQALIQPEQSLQSRRPEERPESGQAAGAIQEKRFALVIGNGAYVGANPLRNPPNDARALSAALREIGFEVVERINLNSREMKKAIIDLGNKLQANDVGLFYYAGHGVQSNGKNYLVPVDAEIEKEADIVVDGVELDTVLAQIEGAKNRLNIVILDACRNDFSTRSWRSQGRGLAQVANAPSGIFIAYATAPGATASDNKSGQNGLYTQELLKALRQPGLRIEEVFKQVRLRVKELSNGQQIPWESSSLEGEFYFTPPSSTVASSNLSRPADARPNNSPATSTPNAKQQHLPGTIDQNVNSTTKLPESFNLVGTWQTTEIVNGQKETITWHIKPDGSTTYLFTSAGGTERQDGFWQFSDGILFEKLASGYSGRGSIKWIDNDQFVLTIIDNGVPAYAGVKRVYRRL